MILVCTINSKINGTPKSLYFPILKLRSILAVAYLLAYNNIWLCYYGQVNTCGVSFILLLKVHLSAISRSEHTFLVNCNK